MIAVKFQTTNFAMEHTLRQLQFDRFLTAVRTGLACVMWWHLMEMFTIAFCHPVAPVKEHPPRRISNRLGKVAVLYHVTRLEFLSNNGIKTFVVEKPIGYLRHKVEPLTRHNIRLLRQCVLRFIPAFTPICLAREVAMKFHKFAFCLSIETRIGYLLAIRSRQKIVCPNVHPTRGFRHTLQHIRHFANDKAIPPPRRLFQRDRFRVSEKWTMLADFHFTKFRHFQKVISTACFTKRLLTNAFVFAQTPRQRSDGCLIARIPFFPEPS